MPLDRGEVEARLRQMQTRIEGLEAVIKATNLNPIGTDIADLGSLRSKLLIGDIPITPPTGPTLGGYLYARQVNNESHAMWMSEDGNEYDLTAGDGGVPFTKRVWRDIRTIANIGGSETQQGTTPNQMAVIRLTGASEIGCQFNWQVPADWVSGAITFIMHYSKVAAGSGDVFHRLNWSLIAVGDATDEVGTNSDQTVAVAADPANLRQVITWADLFTPASAGEFYRLNYRRMGGEAGDTYTGQTDILAFEIQYTAA